MIRMCNECLHVGEHHPNCPNAEDAPPETPENAENAPPETPEMTESEATYVVCDTLNIMFDDWVETDSEFYQNAVAAIKTLKQARGWRL
jgi:hypothetical protein